VPITPFHFGPGLLVKGIAPRSFSWTAFIASNIAIDFESLYYLRRDEWPVHRQLHTFVGAGLVGIGVALVLIAAAWLLPRHRVAAASPAVRGEVAQVGIISGAMIGALSHPVLDGIMHSDIEPFQPWTAANPLHGAVSLAVLHLGCLLCGVVGLVLLLARKR